MEILVLVLALLALDIAAQFFGWDSRPTGLISSDKRGHESTVGDQ